MKGRPLFLKRTAALPKQDYLSDDRAVVVH